MERKPSLLLLDADGVLWRGQSPLPHSAEFVSRAQAAGIRCVLVSNNSTKDRVAYSAQCSAMGIPLNREDIFSSNYIAGPWLARERPGRSVLVLGSESRGASPALRAACARAVRIPIRPELRSLNLATAAAIGLAEALRQLGAWPGAMAGSNEGTDVDHRA